MKKYAKIDKIIILIAYLFFAIPAMMFFLGWYKFYVSIPAIILLGIAVFIIFKRFKEKNEEEYREIFHPKKWIIIITLLFLLNLLSGIGGFAFQNGDHNARNAVMHDLIDYDWPVKYNYHTEQEVSLIGENGYMSYYFAYWLPSAAIGKVLGFNAANVAIFIYQLLGLALFYYFISKMFNKVRLRYFFVLVAFSGLDVIGQILVNKDLLYRGSHIDTWAGYYCFSSIITQIFWVFNQGISSLLIMAIILNERNFKNIGLFMFFLLLFAPFPAVGCVLILLLFSILGIYRFNGEKNNNQGLLKNIFEMFSKQNIIALILIVLLVIFFTLNPAGQSKGFIFLKYDDPNYMLMLVRYVQFWILEFGIISFLTMSSKNYKWVGGLMMIMSIIPIFYIGNGADFVNRVSIPVLIVLMFFLMEKLNQFSWKKMNHILIVIYLIVASITPFNEVYRTLYYTVVKNQFHISQNRNDHWLTYGRIANDDVVIYIKNFSSPYDKEKFVFKYILR